MSGLACLTYRVAGSTWASPVGSVREVLPPQPVTTVAGAPAAVAGLVAVRGEALCVLDARVLLGLAAPDAVADRADADHEHSPVVVVTRAEGAVGLVVDELVDVELLPADAAPSDAASALLGAVDLGGRVVRVVDVARAVALLLDDPQEGDR